MRVLKSTKSRQGRPKGKFTQHRRIDLLCEALEDHPTGLPIAELAEVLAVTPRSVRRYLRELEHRVDVESVATAPGNPHLWRIKPSERARSISLRRSQSLALLTARTIFDPIKGSALFDEIGLVHRQLLQIAHRPSRSGGAYEIAPDDYPIEKRFLYAPRTSRNYSHKHDELDCIFQSIANLHPLQFRHQTADTPVTKYVVHPYALVFSDAAIYCIGSVVATGEVRVFALERISETRVVERERFTIPNDFSVDDYLHGEFGVAHYSSMSRVLVEFDASVAEQVRTNRAHPSQKIAIATDGRVRLSLNVGDIASVAAWVMQFGAAARVIQPPELIAKVREQLQATLERYKTA